MIAKTILSQTKHCHQYIYKGINQIMLRRLFGSRTSADTSAIKENIQVETSSHEVGIIHNNIIMNLGIFITHSISDSPFSFIIEPIHASTFANKVVVYSKSYCPYCITTKQLFATQFPNVDTKVIELDQMKNGSAIQSTLAQMTGQRTVPNVWVKGNFVGGNDDTQSLNRSGKLTELLS